MLREIAQLRPSNTSVEAGNANPPKAVLLIAVLVFFLAASGQTVFWLSLQFVVLVFGIFMLWRPGEPPIFLLIFGMQWLQVSLGTFQANLDWR